MSSYITFPVKVNTATIPLEVNFISQLSSGEAVTSVVVTASVFAGVDATPSSVISGTASLSQNTATQIVTAGTPGVIYLLAWAATTNLGNNLIIYGYLSVLNSTPFVAI